MLLAGRMLCKLMEVIEVVVENTIWMGVKVGVEIEEKVDGWFLEVSIG